MVLLTLVFRCLSTRVRSLRKGLDSHVVRVTSTIVRSPKVPAVSRSHCSRVRLNGFIGTPPAIP
jgi:hypothetical protein